MNPFRVDVHHHIFPPRYAEAERDRIKALTHAFFDRVIAWTPEQSIESMDASLTSTAVLSMSTPGVWFGDGKTAHEYAREFNSFCATLRERFPGRFELLAALPLPDVERSLKEIEFAFSDCKAIGVGLATNAGDIWPGDPKCSAIFEELNRRGAIVFFHPNTTSFSERILPGIPSAAIEFPFDTMRAIASLLFSGTFSRCRNIRFIFSHGGGVLPMLAGRLEGLANHRPDFSDGLPNGVMFELKRQFYDTAGIVNSVAFSAIRSLVGPRQLLFGSDVPFWDARRLATGLDALVADPGERALIDRDNAMELFGWNTPKECNG